MKEDNNIYSKSNKKLNEKLYPNLKRKILFVFYFTIVLKNFIYLEKNRMYLNIIIIIDMEFIKYI